MSGSQGTDSTLAMQSLLTAYADNEGDDEGMVDDSVTEQNAGANFISDDDEERHSPRNDSNGKSFLNNGDIVEESTTDSPTVKRQRLQNSGEAARSTTRLVSYLDDDAEDEDSESNNSAASEEEPAPPSVFGSRLLPENAIVRNGSAVVLNQVQAEAVSQDSLLQSPSSVGDREILLPPEASGKCSKRLQEKVEKLLDKMQREGRDLNYEIQKRKDFRNPSIYEKIIEFCAIDEKGTNYPPELYHPDNWVLDENSYYDKLAQAQADLMQKKEKEAKKSKVERQVGIKKTLSEPSSLGTKHP